MSLHYVEFETTQANLLADLRTQILTSTAWARPNAGSRPDLYKATTTRGADMIFDLSDAAIGVNNLNMAVWRAHDGTTGTDKTVRYLHWRQTGGATTNTLNCVVSISKEHVFISIEGPRPSQSGPVSANYGSPRRYFFMNDLVPYHGNDTTPVVVAGGSPFNSGSSLVAQSNYNVHVSRNWANSASWAPAKLLTLDFPAAYDAATLNVTRQTSADSKHYLAPYVVFGDESGMRGRLASFFFAGYNVADTLELAVPPVGTRVQYQGQWYKLLAVSKGTDVSGPYWDQFGSASNTTATTFHRSPVVAIPCLASS